LYENVDTANPGLLKTLEEKKVLDDDLRAAMTKFIKEYKDTFVADHQVTEKASV